MMRPWTGPLLVVTLVALLIGGLKSVAVAQADVAEPAFQRTWARTDQPVAEGVVGGTWIWGPTPFTGGMQEPYAQSPGGQRLVQYFDKSRMELTQPGEGDPSSPWYVTNGLLAAELIIGRVEVGASEYITRFPAEIPVAGDHLPRNGPSYATFTTLIEPVESRVGQPLAERIVWDGEITSDPALEPLQIDVAVYDDVTGHNIAAPFWSFMTSSRIVYEDGQYVEAPLFENAYYATGRPLTEPYWSDVVVAGTEQLVLIQCFERRCLTYTPGNEPAWQVEAANIGRHYQQWRYGQSTATGTLLFTRGSDIYTINTDGSELRNVTDGLDQRVLDAAWSPNGARIAFVATSDTDAIRGALFVMDADGTELRQLSNGLGDSGPVWSPGGTRLAFSRLVRQGESSFDEEAQIFVINADGTDERQITEVVPQQGFSLSLEPAWSPDGEYIAFRNVNGRPGPNPLFSTVYRVRPDGSELMPLAETVGNGVQVWSPDGEQLAFVSGRGGGNDFTGKLLWVINADGSGVQQLAGGYQSDPDSPAWSPDGDYIAFSQNQSVAGDPRYPNPYLPAGIYLVSPDGSERVRLTHDGESPDWSPDGQYIAFAIIAGDGTGRSAIFVVERSGGELVQITEGGSNPQWRPTE